jgi:D-alanyl-D-alanine carboxypeptidase
MPAQTGRGIAVARVRPVLIGASMTSPEPRTTLQAARQASPQDLSAQMIETQPSPNAGVSQASLPSYAAGMMPSTLQAQAAALENGPAPQAAAPVQVAALPQSAQQPANGSRGPFEIQIGAYADSTLAEQHMAQARARAGGILDPYHAVAIPARKGSTQIYRARFRGFEATAAATTCSQLKRLQIDCFVTRTE